MICFLSGLYQTTRGRGHPLKTHSNSIIVLLGEYLKGEFVLNTSWTGTKNKFLVLYFLRS